MTSLPQSSSTPHSADGGSQPGNWLALPSGWVEIGVYEDGVPPRFRLYFADTRRSPHAPPPANTVQIETVRPNGARQRFTFRDGSGYLESLEEIPEPYEFTVELTVQNLESAHRGSVRFTEEAHGHTQRIGRIKGLSVDAERSA